MRVLGSSLPCNQDDQSKVKILNTFGAQSTFQSHGVDNLRGSLHALQAHRLVEQLTGELRELQDVAARN